MASCNICLDDFKKPVSLPCGHVFCTECVVKTVQAARPQRSVHPCPICRAPYNISPLNPLVFPPHLRPFITPTIRRVYIESPENAGESSSSSPSTPPIAPAHLSEEISQLRGENQTLREHCVLWRRRAELHGAATLGLLDFARMVRDQAVSLARERDELERQCQSYKRKLDDHDEPSEPERTASRTVPFPPTPLGFSDLPRSQTRLTSPTNSSPSSPTTSLPYPPTTVEASRMAVAALFDLHSYMNQPNTSELQQRESGVHPRVCSSRSRYENMAGPSSSSAPSSSTPMSPSSSTSSGIAPAQQPSPKRVRRESEEIRRLGGGRMLLPPMLTAPGDGRSYPRTHASPSSSRSHFS